MTTYNTGNALGSSDARDLYDNAENFDNAINGPGLTWVDRRGVTRPTWQGAIEDGITAAELVAGDGASKVGYQLAGGVVRDVAGKLGEFVSVKDFGAVGDGVTDDTDAIQDAYNTGKSVYHPDGEYSFVSLTLSANDVTLFGKGKLVKRAGVDGVGLTITGKRNHIFGMHFDGSAAAPTPNFNNDMIRITGTDGRNVIESCVINGSKGGAINIYGSGGNKVLNNTILNVRDNGVLIAGAGADNNLVSGNFIDGTTVQNCIFVTASADSTANGQYVYGTVITNNYCANSGDTCIESGYHTERTVISGNVCTNSVNPPILLRDAFACNVENNIVITKPFADQISTHDGIAVVPHHESSSYNSNSLIANNTVIGATKRSAIFLGQAGITVSGNRIEDNKTAVNSDGSNLSGSAILWADGGVSRIVCRDNYIRNYKHAIDFNYVGAAVTIIDASVSGNVIHNVQKAFNGYNCTWVDCDVSRNFIKAVSIAGLDATLAIASGGLRYVDNMINLAGFSGVSPASVNPITFFRACGIRKDYDSIVATVPENQYGIVTVRVAGNQLAGTCTVQFADMSEVATFALGGSSGAGTGTTTKLIGTTNLLDSTGSGGFSGWSLFYDGGGNLIFQRRGNNTGASARLMKVIIRDAG